MASAILAFASAALSHAVFSGQAHTYQAAHEARALMVLHGTLEHVLTKPYEDPDGDTTPGPDASETSMGMFDALDDFHGFTQTPSNLTDATGTLLPETFQRFTRSIRVEPASSGTLGVFNAAFNGLNITVDITDDRGQSWTLERFVPEGSLVAGSSPRASVPAP